jgi:GrpB-like predicted nucleotidyltransferase (UPF0157 family)
VILETLEEKIRRVTAEEIAIVPYNPRWPILFEMERNHLRACLPPELIGRIEHFGSTAVPGLPAKPIIDILAEVADLGETKRMVVPILEGQGYEYFWRPSFDDDRPPFYAWFIKRDAAGRRTHHIHMVESDSELWDRLLFRDYLIAHPETAREYGALKTGLAEAHRGDRVAYTRAKTDFIADVMRKAKEFFGEKDRV